MKKTITRSRVLSSSTHEPKNGKTIEQLDGHAQKNNQANGLTSQKNPLRGAGAFKDDPFWDEMMAFIKAERAEIDAAQK